MTSKPLPFPVIATWFFSAVAAVTTSVVAGGNIATLDGNSLYALGVATGSNIAIIATAAMMEERP